MLNVSAKLRPHFKGFCSSPSVIMLFVYMKCRFSLSYRDLEEMMIIRGAKIDHSTLQRWVKRFVFLIDKRVRQRKKAVNGSWRVTVDKSGSNKVALDSFNKDIPEQERIEIRQINYLNNIVEQDPRFIKKRTRPTLGFKTFQSAKATISGIENIRMIQKGQILGQTACQSAFKNFAALMA